MPSKLSDNKLIVAISKGAEAVFQPGDWERLALATEFEEYLASTRLLRSYSFGDSDYGGHVVDFVRRVVRSKHTAEFREFLEENEPDAHYTIDPNEHEEGEEAIAEPTKPPPPAAQPRVTSPLPPPASISRTPVPVQVAAAPVMPSPPSSPGASSPGERGQMSQVIAMNVSTSRSFVRFEILSLNFSREREVPNGILFRHVRMMQACMNTRHTR